MNDKRFFHRNNKGFSLLELVVVVAITATFVGILVPQVVKYIETNKRDACRQNREAILSVYEKCVYNMTLDASTESLETLLAASDSSKLPQDYMNQVKDYLSCPEDNETGHYHVGFFENTEGGKKVAKAVITCDCHTDDACVVDLTGWVAKADEDLTDGEITPPSSDATGLPFEPDMSGSDEDDEDDEPLNEDDVYASLGVWPYTHDPDGKTDIRWKKSGTAVGKYVSISVPQYAHFKDRSDREYVIVRPNDSTGKGYKVMYENSESPSMCANKDGVLYDITDSKRCDLYIRENGSRDTDPGKNDSGLTSSDVAVAGETDKWRVVVSADLGDIVTIHFANGTSCTYLYTGVSKNNIEIPTAADQGYGVGYEEWYVVPTLYE